MRLACHRLSGGHEKLARMTIGAGGQHCHAWTLVVT